MNLDDRMNRFRLASRELRNHYFRSDDPDNPWVAVQRFDEVERVLFENMVSAPLGLPTNRYKNVNPNIVVVPGGSFGVPIMINRGKDVNHGYWDHPTTRIDANAKLLFVRFFDWDEMGYMDNQYVMVLIAECSSDPDLIGRYALIESQYVRFQNAA